MPVWTPLPAAYQFGSWAAGPVATGGKVAPGRFLVRFPNIGLGARGNAHVTAVARDGRFCQLVRWGSSGADEIVDVQCFRPGGTPTDTPFTVLWTVSSGVLPAGVGAYASAQVLSNVLAQSYNSAGAPVTVANVGVGIYALRFLAVGTAGTLSGNVQVTAQQPNAQPRRCKILRWGATGPDVLVYVACHDPATGALINSDFTASFHRERSVYASFGPPKYFGYLATPFVGPTNYSHPLGVGANGFGPTGLGTYTVKFPALHEKSTTAQVTAIGDDPRTAPSSPDGRSSAATRCCRSPASATPAGRRTASSARPSRRASEPGGPRPEHAGRRAARVPTRRRLRTRSGARRAGPSDARGHRGMATRTLPVGDPGTPSDGERDQSHPGRRRPTASCGTRPTP